MNKTPALSKADQMTGSSGSRQGGSFLQAANTAVQCVFSGSEVNVIKLEELFFRKKFLMDPAVHQFCAGEGRCFQKNTTKSVIFAPSKITRVKTVGFQPAFQEIFVSGRQASRIDSIITGLFLVLFEALRLSALPGRTIWTLLTIQPQKVWDVIFPSSQCRVCRMIKLQSAL